MVLCHINLLKECARFLMIRPFVSRYTSLIVNILFNILCIVESPGMTDFSDFLASGCRTSAIPPRVNPMQAKTSVVPWAPWVMTSLNRRPNQIRPWPKPRINMIRTWWRRPTTMMPNAESTPKNCPIPCINTKSTRMKHKMVLKLLIPWKVNPMNIPVPTKL